MAGAPAAASPPRPPHPFMWSLSGDGQEGLGRRAGQASAPSSESFEWPAISDVTTRWRHRLCSSWEGGGCVWGQPEDGAGGTWKVAAAGAGGGPSRLSPSAGPRRPVAAWPRALGSALPRSPPPGVSWRLGLAPGAARGASEWRSRAGPPGGVGAPDGPWVGTGGSASGTPPGTPSLCGGHLRPAGCPPAALSLLDPRWTPAGRREEAGRAEARPAEQALLSFIPGSKLGSLGVEEGCQGTE